MEEIWNGLIYQGKDLSQWYEVSTKGRLRNSKTKYIELLHKMQSGYYAYVGTLGSRRLKKTIRIHRAVAETFIPNPFDLREVNHKDGIKSHNDIKNLEWVTGKENMAHASKYRLLENAIKCGERASNAKLTNKQAKEIIELYASGRYTQKQLAEMYKISRPKISQITREKAYNESYICRIA